MTRLFFPYQDTPKQLLFKLPQQVRFPFYVNDLVYYWEAGTDGVTVYLLNNKIDPSNPVIKDIVIEETGITVYLYNQTTQLSQQIFVEYGTIESKIATLGDIDPYTLQTIDPFTLGHTSGAYANWMEMRTSVVTTIVATEAQ